MKKIILLAGLVAGGVALSVTASANNWLLYLPAILAGSGGGTTPPPTPVTGPNKWLLFLPPILAASQGGAVITEPPFNDTGIVLDSGGGACTSTEEDCNYGRDADGTKNDPSDGHAGFSFTKLDASGGELASDATSWACVRDNVTGLVWTDYATWGAAQQYTWLAAQETYAPGYTNCGIASGGWRVPTPKELMSIAAYNEASGSIDSTYFHLPPGDTIETQPVFWTVRESISDTSYAWYLHFEEGFLSGTTGKDNANYIRLVHGTALTADLTDNGDETVTDASTGLIWKKCLEGASGADCTTGAPVVYTWTGALGLAGSGWRLPNIKELQSIVDYYQSPSPAIDPAMFPGVPTAADVWSNSPAAASLTPEAWYIGFASGYSWHAAQTTNKYVLLVKDAP